jgi:hypothetical protein
MDVEMEDEYFTDDDEGDGSDDWDTADEDEDWPFFNLGVARVPRILLSRTAAVLRNTMSDTGCLPRAWMWSIAYNFRSWPLHKLRALDPSLIPPWLLQDFEAVQVMIYRAQTLLYIPRLFTLSRPGTSNFTLLLLQPSAL